MIKIGLRRNLRYPVLFIIFTLSRRVVKYIMEVFCLEGRSVSFLMVSFMIILELILGLIYSCKNENTKKDKEIESKKDQIKIVEIDNEIKSPDSLFKIRLLMFFSGYLRFLVF